MLGTESTHAPAGPHVDVTLRNVPALEPAMARVRAAAAETAQRTGHPGPFLVVLEALPTNEIFITVRLGRDPSGPEWGLTARDLDAAVGAAFRSVKADLAAKRPQSPA